MNQNYNQSIYYNKHTVSNIAMPCNNKRITVIALTNNGETLEPWPTTKTFETIFFTVSDRINKKLVFKRLKMVRRKPKTKTIGLKMFTQDYR